MKETKFGELSDEIVYNYLDRLIGAVYKCLPMKEKNDETLDKYLESLLRELNGNKELIYELKNDALFLKLLGTLTGLKAIDDLEHYKSDVFKSINLIKKIKQKHFVDLLQSNFSQ